MISTFLSHQRRRMLQHCWFLLLASTLPAFAQVNGSIFTTTNSGTTVNGNIYDAKTSVYLGGGPQNKNDAGLQPDGTYYFQVTDPSGAVLLSADDISCRQVVVSNGSIIGVPGGKAPATCNTGFHALGTYNPANGETPVQLCGNTSSPRTDNLGAGTNFDAYNWCDTTPNSGGEYKVWVTPAANYNGCSNSNYGFCNSDSKTDNFKVNKSTSAYITVCKFDDLDGDGVQDPSEPFLPGWPINATGVDTLSGSIGTVNTQTGADGCVSLAVSDFTTAKGQVTISEGTLTGSWRQTAPKVGTYSIPDGVVPADKGNVTVTVSNNGAPPNSQSFKVAAGDRLVLANFGNTCLDSSCGGNAIELTMTEDANPSLARTYAWGITKSVDKNTVYSQSGGNSAPANYTVNVIHDKGTDSGWQTTGTIKITNPSWVDIGGVDVVESVSNGGACTVENGSAITIPAKSEVDLLYTCSYSSLPVNGTSTATATWNSGTSTPGKVSGTAAVSFAKPAVKVVDGSAVITDKLDNSTPTTLGTASYSAPSPITYSYSRTFSDRAGACTSHTNNVTFTTNSTRATGAASAAVQNCPAVNNTALTVACSTSNVGQVGAAFNSPAMSVTGGTAPYTFTVVGTLPAGLKLNSAAGAVTGTPKAAGAFSVKVTDAKGATATACPFTIYPAPPIATPGSPSCTFGTALAYNLVALNGNINDAADITGRIAASGQVLQSTTVGSDLRTSDPFIASASKNGGPFAIVAAGGIPTSNWFNVNAGGNVYSSTATKAGFNFANENYQGSLYAGSKLVTGGSSPINFSALRTSMNTLSTQLAGLTANGAVCSVNNSGAIVAGNGCPAKPTYFNPGSQHYNPSWLVLYGTNPTTNVFNLTQAQFQSTRNLDIEVPTGSAVIINVAGTSDTLQRDIYFQGRTVTLANAGNILFNFPTATSVTMNGAINATVLAPQAYLSGGSQMGGLFIAKSIGPTGEVHYGPFGVKLPISGACSQ
jgi:choice-of-anchor A domain-containing protein